VVQKQYWQNFGNAPYSTSSYEAYGKKGGEFTSFGTAPTHHDPSGFGGQFGYYTDTETGLLCLTHRYYDPGTGKFINRDPIGYGGGMNLYGFADGNPVNESDPSGLSMDPMPTAGPNWVRVSVALFIPMKEFASMHPSGGYVTHKGDGRSFNYNTNADRVRVDFALNIATGQLVKYPPHTAGSTMTEWNGYTQTQNASMSDTITAKRSGTGWQIFVHGEGYDPFYDLGNAHTSPGASFTATFNINGTNVGGSVKYRQFPSIEIYAYNRAYPGGHKCLFGYQPSGAIQHTLGVLTLTGGEKYHANF
jgi:RHS repeat-associated protein